MTLSVSRRAALAMIGGATASTLFPFGRAESGTSTGVELRSQWARYRITDRETTGLVSTRPDGPPPVLRLRQGRRFDARVINGLDDYTTMHWHGLRLPNAMEGVPYLTQFPTAPDEAFDYSFTPPDAGTYWYHPHCMTLDQMALSLAGVMAVDEHENPDFDSEVILNLRDFRLGDDGEWLDLWTPRGAARGGSCRGIGPPFRGAAS